MQIISPFCILRLYKFATGPRFFSVTTSEHATDSKRRINVQAKWLGRVSYSGGLRFQSLVMKAHKEFLERNSNSKIPAEIVSGPNTLLMLEHDPVYTVGIRDGSYSKDEERRLVSTGAEFHRTDRGGLITFHGHGQLVVYPILDLGNFGKIGRGRWYVEQIEKTLIRVCEGYGIRAGTSPHTGVWTGPPSFDRKIAAIGIHITGKRITSHGLALNCNTDLKWFDNIVPCGIEGKGVTSISKEVGRDVPVPEVLKPFCDAFGEQFGCNVVLENLTHSEMFR